MEPNRHLALLGDELRRCRKARGLTQEELGSRIGKSTATISKIESANQPLDMATFLLLADELEISPYVLLLRAQTSGHRQSRARAEVLRVFEDLASVLAKLGGRLGTRF
jgi:transcriptional regulator with XRE-family HTH domain